MEEIFVNSKIILTEIIFDENAKMWHLKWGDQVMLMTGSFWRVFKRNKLLEVSPDHLQKLSYEEPQINLKAKLLNLLQPEFLQKVKTTCNNDLVFDFTNDIKLIIYVSSMAFENWELSVFNKQYICLQAGYDLAVIDN